MNRQAPHHSRRSAARRGATRRPTRLLIWAVVLTALFAPAAVPGAASAGTLSQSISAVLARYHLTAASSVAIWDESAGRVVFRSNSTLWRVPASNAKLATAATALASWGAAYRFKTQLFVSRLPAAGTTVLRGSVFLKGYGDPSLSTRAYQRRSFSFSTASLESFVAKLKALGVKRITGSIFGDGTYFDRLRSAPGWLPSFVHTECGALSALTVDEGLYKGRPVASSPLYVVSTLTRMLTQAGITVVGRPRLGTVPQSAKLVQTLSSAPLSTLLRFMDKHSDNFFAEMFTKGLGASFRGIGSTAAGLSVTRTYLASLGLSAKTYRLYDGSGLSYWDRFSALNVERLLRGVARRPDASVFVGSLSIAGVDGTLRRRMRNTAAQANLVAKTGSLAIACCLSGYVTTANGHRVVFSMLMNGRPINYAAAAHVQDTIGVALAKAHLPGFGPLMPPTP